MKITTKNYDVAEKNGEQGVFTGYASTYGNIDYAGDVIMAGAYADQLGKSLPIIWNHDSDDPSNIIGKTTRLESDSHGLLVEAALDLDNPTAKQAYNLLKKGIVSQLSVGIIPDETQPADGGTRLIKHAQLLEISVTPSACNPQANITTVKNLQEGQPMTDTTQNTTDDTTDTTDGGTIGQYNIQLTGKATAMADHPAGATKSAQPRTNPAPVQTKPRPVQTKNTDDLQAAGRVFDTTATEGPQRLDVAALRKAMPRQIIKQAAAHGVMKGIGASGAALFPIPFVNTVNTAYAADTTAEHAPRLVDLLPTVTRTASIYDAITETGPTGSAKVVKPGDTKPAITFNLSKVEKRLQVIAAMSEPIDKYVLQDTANLETYVGNRLTDKLLDALETEILTGDGQEGHLTGLASIAGIQTQEYDNSMLDTLAAGINKLETIGVNAATIAMAPADWLKLQRGKNANGDYYMSNVLDAVTRRAWGVTIATVAGLTAGTCYIIGQNSLTLSTDGQIDVEWNPYTDFAKNQTVARAESRWQLDCYSPQRVVKATIQGE